MEWAALRRNYCIYIYIYVYICISRSISRLAAGPAVGTVAKLARLPAAAELRVVELAELRLAHVRHA